MKRLMAQWQSWVPVTAGIVLAAAAAAAAAVTVDRRRNGKQVTSATPAPPADVEQDDETDVAKPAE
jgi:hypothetical protein